MAYRRIFCRPFFAWPPIKIGSAAISLDATPNLATGTTVGSGGAARGRDRGGKGDECARARVDARGVGEVRGLILPR
jgi:hypothetical protein